MAGWNYRKRITIAPGVRLNVSNRGVSTTFGVRGASITYGRNGTYLNTGIPGTGIYHRQKIGGITSSINVIPQDHAANTSNDGCIVGVVFIMLVILIAGLIAMNNEDATIKGLGYLMLAMFAICLITIIVARLSNNNKTVNFQYATEISNANAALSQTTDPIKRSILETYSKCLEINSKLDETNSIIEALKKKSSNKYRDQLIVKENEQALLNKEIDLARINIDEALSEHARSSFADFCAAFEKVLSSEKIWIINSQTKNHELKSSAATLIDKKEIEFNAGVFDYIKSEFDIPIINDTDGIKYYFYPQYIIRAKSSINFDILPLKSIDCKFSTVRFIESGAVPSDSSIIDYTYQYVNKSGGPDLRYSYNPKHPVVQYGKLEIPQFNLVYHVSSPDSLSEFVEEYNLLRGNSNDSGDEVYISSGYFNDISVSVEKIIDFYKELCRLPNFIEELVKSIRNSHIDIDGFDLDSSSQEEKQLLSLIWLDTAKCHLELIGNIDLNTLEGMGLFYFQCRICGVDKDDFTYDKALFFRERLLKSTPSTAQTLADNTKVSILLNHEPEGVLFISTILKDFDSELNSIYVTLLYRFSSIITKSDGTVSEREAKWLSRLMDLNNSAPNLSEKKNTAITQLDTMIREIAEYVIQNEQGSTSAIQRKFAIGFNRASRIMDQLEELGIVGRAIGSTPREVILRDTSALDTIIDEASMPKQVHAKVNHQLSSVDPIEELNSLIGLDSVKAEVKTLTNFIKIQQARESQGLKSSSLSCHCVFTGNPGTGKTTVARIVADIYKNIGILKKGHLVETDRAGLVAEYVGQTAVKTNKIIDSALDGVLFIDEAYSLVSDSGNDYGKEAIATLLKRMEDDRSRLVIILAGYTGEMQKFINSNPGLQSRFNRYIEFPDYSPQELLKIFLSNVKKNDYSASADVEYAALELFERAVDSKDDNFGNARFARNIFEKILERQANRLATEPNLTMEKLSEITIADLM